MRLHWERNGTGQNNNGRGMALCEFFVCVEKELHENWVLYFYGVVAIFKHFILFCLFNAFILITYNLSVTGTILDCICSIIILLNYKYCVYHYQVYILKSSLVSLVGPQR